MHAFRFTFMLEIGIVSNFKLYAMFRINCLLFVHPVQLLACTNNSSICFGFMNFEKESLESWFEKRQQNRISVKEW